MQSLVLASASARRRAYLEELGAAFDIVPTDVDEAPRAGEAPEEAALRLAEDKARAAARRAPGRWVLAADTIVALEDSMLGKPTNREDARRMLRLLAGRGHRVITAVVLLDPTGVPVVRDAVTTRVRFRALSEDEIAAYVSSGEADDKAGAYGIQGAAGAFVERREGSLSNVVGLPLEIVEPALRRAGLLPHS